MMLFGCGAVDTNARAHTYTHTRARTHKRVSPRSVSKWSLLGSLVFSLCLLRLLELFCKQSSFYCSVVVFSQAFCFFVAHYLSSSRRSQNSQLSGTGFKDLLGWQLARQALHGLAVRNPNLDLNEVDRIIYGNVIQEVFENIIFYFVVVVFVFGARRRLFLMHFKIKFQTQHIASIIA